MTVKILMTKFDRHVLSIHPLADGSQSRVVKVWTWPDGKHIVMEGMLPVPSLEVARLHVVPGALRVNDSRVPADFAEEVYMYSPALVAETEEQP